MQRKQRRKVKGTYFDYNACNVYFNKIKQKKNAVVFNCKVYMYKKMYCYI